MDLKGYILIILFSVLCWTLRGQVISVRDEVNFQSLEMVTVASENPKIFLTTDAKGRVDISDLEGADTIQFRTLGYEVLTLSYEEVKDFELLILLHPEGLSLVPFDISVTRWKQSSRGIPSKAIRVTKADIQLQNPQTAADLLGSSGEVFIQKSQQGGGSPMIRGFATNRLLITVDGVRMNNAIFRGGNVQNVIALDPFATEKTEVYFGPGSVIFGSDAIGGVMSFHSLEPKLSKSENALVKGNAVVRYASANNEKTGHFDINLGWKKMALVTSFSSNDYGDLRMGAFGPDEYLRNHYVQRQDGTDIVLTNDDPLVQTPSAYKQMNMMQKVRFRPNKKWDLDYGLHYSATSGYARYDRHLRQRNGLPRSAEWNYGPQTWLMHNLRVAHKGDNFLYDEMAIQLAAQNFKESRINRDFGTLDRATNTEWVDAYSVNLDFNKDLGKKSKLLYGAEGILNDVASSGIAEDIETGIVAKSPSRYPQASWQSYGGYANLQHRFSDKISSQASVRYNQFLIDATFDTTFYPFPFTNASLNNGATTGSLGLVFNPNKKMTLSINASTGFRSPNVDDIGKVFDSGDGIVVVPNPKLKAEYAKNIEVSWVKIFGNYLKFDITGYYTQLDDALVRRDFQLNGQDSILYNGEMSKVQAIQNAAKANVYGFQTGLEIRLPYGFGITSRFNYQNGEEELSSGEKSALRHAAPWFGTTHLTFSAQQLKLDFYGSYSGEVSFDNMPLDELSKPYLYASDQDGNPYSPAWYTLNCKVMYQLTENFSMSSGLENITNIRYRPYSSGLVAPGRNFIISLRANF